MSRQEVSIWEDGAGMSEKMADLELGEVMERKWEILSSSKKEDEEVRSYTGKRFWRRDLMSCVTGRSSSIVSMVDIAVIPFVVAPEWGSKVEELPF